MIKVCILGFEYALATSITGVVDLLSTAGTALNFFQGKSLAPKFEVRLASRGGRPIRCLNAMKISAQCSLDEIGPVDVIMVPSIGGAVDKALNSNRDIVELLQRYHQQGTLITSNCTGAFFLAEAGILDGRKATTHWAHVNLFRQRYPQVELVPEQLITTDGQVFCSGGGSSWFDLGLYLVELYADHDTAIESAKAMVLDRGRHSQLTYFSAYEKDHGHRCDVEAGMAKLLGARVAWAAADNGLQIHGGNGFALEYKISRVLCDARILNIFEGAAEIQAQVIARRLLSGN